MQTELTIFDESSSSHVLLKTTDRALIREKLSEIGIQYETWAVDEQITADSTPEQILSAYNPFIQNLITQGGYKTFDVIALNTSHPDKVALRAKFLNEHTHGEDEVRFFVDGSGLFTVHTNGQVYNILCVKGDLINVPAGIKHWFDMSAEPRFVAIRVFNNPEGWVAKYTEDDIASRFPRYELEPEAPKRRLSI